MKDLKVISSQKMTEQWVQKLPEPPVEDGDGIIILSDDDDDDGGPPGDTGGGKPDTPATEEKGDGKKGWSTRNRKTIVLRCVKRQLEGAYVLLRLFFQINPMLIIIKV